MSVRGLPLLALAALLPGGDAQCSNPGAPYTVEPNPFGWPLTPGGWSYVETTCWNRSYGGYATCGGMHQSPIDIISSGVVNQGGGPGVLNTRAKYKAVGASTARVSSYLRTVVVEGDFGSLELDTPTGKKTYQAVQIHLTSKSLHKLDGNYLAAEMIVWHVPAGSPSPASEHVAVSVLFNHDMGSSPIFTSLGFPADGSALASESRSSWAIDGVNIVPGMTSALSDDSWHYNGSLPVPPCSETVKWFVLKRMQPVNENQTLLLHAMMQKWAAGDEWSWLAHDKRPPMAVGNRIVQMNTAAIGNPHHADTCKMLKAMNAAERSSDCWALEIPSCGQGLQSPIALVQSTPAAGTTMNAAGLASYKAMVSKEELMLTPGMFALEATVTSSDGFGELTLNGRILPARKISVRPVSQHVINGERAEAELVIEHSLFGEMEGDQAHHVLVAVPIKLGQQENVLLRQLSLGSPLGQSIAHGLPFSPTEDLKLADGMKAILAGQWFWYTGSLTEPNCGQPAKWMVFVEPIRATLSQINDLVLQVPGIASTRMLQPLAGRVPYQNTFPESAVEQFDECVTGAPWSYSATHCWGIDHPVCGNGRHQSPINIVTADVVRKTDADIFLSATRWKPVSKLHLENNGHTLKIANEQMGYVVQVGEDGNAAYYQLAQFHVHMPSEHTIDGKQFHAEVHVVHFKQITVEELNPADALVTAFLLDVGDMHSPLLQQMMMPGTPPKVTNKTVVEEPIDLMRAFGPPLKGNFFRYNGGLTTPGCDEIVKWYVFETPLSMSMEQWQTFKELYPNPSNNRPTQPLNDRQVAYNSFEAPGETLQLNDYEFWSSREGGRSRRAPGALYVLIPIAGTLVLCTLIMCATFVREDRKWKEDRAGGLAETIGRGQYSRF